MNYSRNAKYFKPGLSPKPIFIFLLIVGILFPTFPGLAITALIVAGIILCIMFIGKPKTEEIDQIANDELKNVEKLALKKLGLEKEELSLAEPIQFRGWEYWTNGRRKVDDEELRKCVDVMDKDSGIWRSPVITLHYFGFSENMIHHYVKYISMVSATYKETTEEFFYQDIVSAKTDSSDEPAWDYKKKKEDPDKRVHRNFFMLRSAGGDTIQCNVANLDDAETSVNAMRALLKQKKMQTM